MFQGAGYCTQRGHLFLAIDLSQGPAQREPSEQDLICRTFEIEEVMAMVRNGAIRDALTIAALCMLRLKALL